jgi:purine-nucleoside phosphorylase
MSELKKSIEKALKKIRTITDMEPEIGIILGTGLGGLANEIKDKLEINYGDIPDFPVSTIETHAGKLVFGTINGKKIVAMQGRFHRYEGYTLKQVVFPVYVMKELGVKMLMVSNAAGGINKTFNSGDLMIITDHISLFLGDNPLIGENDETIGSRYPDMFDSYNPKLIELAFRLGKDQKIRVVKGTYAVVTGPNLETKAEYRLLGILGADAVGMSTVPEVIAARHCGLEVLGISVITDKCDPDTLEPADIQKIIKIAMEAEPKLTNLMKSVINEAKL